MSSIYNSVNDLEELRELKTAGKGSILQNISNSIIERWHKEYFNQFMQEADIKRKITDLDDRLRSNKQILEQVENTVQKLGTSTVKYEEFNREIE